MASKFLESLRFWTNASNPSSPTEGDSYWNSTSGNKMLHIYDGTRFLAAHGIEAYVFSKSGTLTTGTGVSRIYLEGSYVVDTIRASVGTQPTGASVIVDVNKNGTTLYTTQSARPTIAVSTNTATGNSPAVTTFAAGDYMTVDIDQIGSTIAGADLTVAVRLRRYT